MLLVQAGWRYVTACHEQQYDLLNPAFVCASPVKYNAWDYESLRNSLFEKVIAWKSEGTITHVSVYFRDLTHGPRFGIEEYEKFFPASLLKVPAMIAILHEADRDPTLLDETLSFSGEMQGILNVQNPDEMIQPDTPYTIRDLLWKMIVYSDNYSKNLLARKLDTIPPPTVYDTFLDLGIIDMMKPDAKYISIQDYATLFAILHNTGYLSREMSQYALSLLTQTTYKHGLVAGVPPETRVAHKFGFRSISPTQSQLHDCGIVYHPSASYVLCVMTSGSEIKDEAVAIADISKTVYDRVTAMEF